MFLLSPSAISHFKTAAVAYGLVVGAFMAYNLRWRYIGDFFGRRKPKKLPLAQAKGITPRKQQRHVVIVLLHGMWNDAAWFEKLQTALQQRGYTSWAIDMLPGERFFVGFTQKEIVADLEATLLSKLKYYNENAELIWLGHSQGGLVVQACLQQSPSLHKRTKGIVLMGTMPLGMTPPVGQIVWRQPRKNMYLHPGYLGICGFGRLFTTNYLKHIFLLPTTDPMSTQSLQEYTTKLLQAPSDGLITMSHFPQRVGILSQKPTLVIGAKHDIIYPPHLLEDGFRSRFPNSQQGCIDGQAHCFMDPLPDEEEGIVTMESILLSWLHQVV